MHEFSMFIKTFFLKKNASPFEELAQVNGKAKQQWNLIKDQNNEENKDNASSPDSLAHVNEKYTKHGITLKVKRVPTLKILQAHLKS